MKTHYDPFYNVNDYHNEESSEVGYCGTLLNEDYYNATNRKEDVSCKKCIKMFDKADKEMEIHSKHFANDCQGFVDFMNEAESKP
jgi:hypothetical protein